LRYSTKKEEEPSIFDDSPPRLEGGLHHQPRKTGGAIIWIWLV
jgi:hypothetical protein